ncbi:hypothetical protein J6590_062587 [Homalodisca vitripennis]|nr:hypothetical protein J6590_062587 [Homalodisca vitripennis]
MEYQHVVQDERRNQSPKYPMLMGPPSQDSLKRREIHPPESKKQETFNHSNTPINLMTATSSTTRHPYRPPQQQALNPRLEACTVLNTYNIIGESVPKATSLDNMIEALGRLGNSLDEVTNRQVKDISVRVRDRAGKECPADPWHWVHPIYSNRNPLTYKTYHTNDLISEVMTGGVELVPLLARRRAGYKRKDLSSTDVTRLTNGGENQYGNQQ